MPYTLWSKGRLVGHTDLGFRESTPGVRFGWFHPTDTGQPICDLLNAPRLLMLRAAQRGDTASVEAEYETATATADALALELRDADGSVVKTESIGVHDMEVTLAYGDLSEHEELDPEDPNNAEILAAVAHDLELLDFEPHDEAVELEPLPRYQIIVHLEGCHELMMRELLTIDGDDGLAT